MFLQMSYEAEKIDPRRQDVAGHARCSYRSRRIESLLRQPGRPCAEKPVMQVDGYAAAVHLRKVIAKIQYYPPVKRRLQGTALEAQRLNYFPGPERISGRHQQVGITHLSQTP